MSCDCVDQNNLYKNSVAAEDLGNSVDILL